jgi:FkbM family methyltransferase
MKQRYPESKIICIEPDTENFNMLKKNVSSYNDVYCEHGGIWDKDTKLIAYDKYNRGKWGIVVEENINGNISAISINTLIAKYDIQYIDILKLDIETSEKQLFSNNYDIWLPKIKTIIIELHDRIEEGCSKSFFEAINRSFSKYTFSMKGENVIIENNDMNNV